jgi:hypothetical protein
MGLRLRLAVFSLENRDRPLLFHNLFLGSVSPRLCQLATSAGQRVASRPHARFLPRKSRGLRALFQQQGPLLRPRCKSAFDRASLSIANGEITDVWSIPFNGCRV